MTTALTSLLYMLVGVASSPGGVMAEFGTYYNMVLVLCAINTVGCLCLVWLIFKNK